jgi:EvpB/VC_A0108, tail sheath N-terminal domain/Type VI secretion system, VipA, VC_A0107 or Hcp2
MAESILPYKILVLGPFAPVPDGKFKPDFVKLDLYSIDEALETLAPVLYLPLPLGLCADGALTLKFNKIKDFKPGSIIKNNEFLKSLSEVKKSTPVKDSEPDYSKIVTKKSDAVDDILSMVEVPDTPSDEINGENSVDGNVSAVMHEIFSNTEFRRTESAWRSVQTLAKQAQIKGFNKISVSVSSVSHNSLEHILDAIESMPHDEVPNLILIDLDFDNTMPSIDLLEKVIQCIDKMMIPACINIKPGFFRIDDFNDLDKLPYINNHLDDISYAKFRKLRELPGASWLIVNCNEFAVRPANEFESTPLSGSSVFATGTLCAKAINEAGWPMKFTKYNTCTIDDLPMFNAGDRNTASTRALFSDERIIQLAEAGITPVVGARNKDFVFIPKESSLSGDSIKFQMFFNRIIESIMNLMEKSVPGLIPEDGIKQALNDIFIQTGHDKPVDLSIIKGAHDAQDQDVFKISFVPPPSVIANSNMIEFSFVW